MHTPKQIAVNQVFTVLLMISLAAAPVIGKSLYVITDRDSTVKAYRIQDDQIEEQTTAQGMPDRASAVGFGRERGFGWGHRLLSGKNDLNGWFFCIFLRKKPNLSSTFGLPDTALL